MSNVMRSQLIGTAAEFAVASELLFRGFNAQPVVVDAGVDVICWKDQNRFEVQVKSRVQSERSGFSFGLRKKSFERYNSSSNFYIFVLRMKDKTNLFIILPASYIEQQISQGVIKLNEKRGLYRINIRLYDDGFVGLNNKQNDIRYYVNNWDIIK